VDYSTKKFRCVSKRLKDNFTSEISAVSHDPDVYLIDYVIDIDPLGSGGAFEGEDRRYGDPSVVPGVVQSLRLSERSWWTDEAIDASWLPPETGVVDHYNVWIGLNGSSKIWGTEYTTKNVSISIPHAVSGTTYKVIVAAVSPTGKRLPHDDAASDTIAIA